MIYTNPDWTFLKICVVILIIILIICAIVSTNRYNSGICSICGGHYELFSVAGHRYTNEYFYKCTNCGNVIKTSFKMN